MAARRFSIASLTRSCGWTSQLRQCVPRPAYAVPLPVTPLRSLLPFRQAVRNLSAAGGERPKHVWSTGASARASIEDLTNVTSGREADARVPTAAECVTAISDAMNAGVSPMKLVSNIAAQTTFVPISFDLANTCMNAAVMCKDFDVVLMLCDLYSKLQIVPDLSVSERAVATASAAKMHAVAVKLFEVMVKYGLDASQLACVQAAVSYAHIGKPEITVGLVRRLADDDAAVLTPSVLESLIDVLCETGDIDKAFDVFLIAETRHVQLSGDVVGRLLALSSHDIERVKPVIEYSLKWSKMQDYAVKNIAANAMAALPETSHFDALISLIGKSSRPGDDVLLCNLLLTVFGKVISGAVPFWLTLS
jgi:pentatricopeptide repeat protein